MCLACQQFIAKGNVAAVVGQDQIAMTHRYAGFGLPLALKIPRDCINSKASMPCRGLINTLLLREEELDRTDLATDAACLRAEARLAFGAVLIVMPE